MSGGDFFIYLNKTFYTYIYIVLLKRTLKKKKPKNIQLQGKR